MSEMKCPFCGKELETMFGISKSVLGCHKCRHIATIGVWQALIDGKKAQDALKEIVANPHGAACHNYCRAKRVLEEIGEITSITKQDKMS